MIFLWRKANYYDRLFNITPGIRQVGISSSIQEQNMNPKEQRQQAPYSLPPL